MYIPELAEAQTAPGPVTVANEAVPPLSPASDRREIHRRLVGPIATSILINSLDAYRQKEYEDPSNLQAHITDWFSALTELYNDDPSIGYRQVETLLSKTFHLEVFNGLIDTAGDEFTRHNSRRAPYLTGEQTSLIQPVVFHKLNLLQMVFEGYTVQQNATLNFALPGYLSVSEGLDSPDEIVRHVISGGPEGVANILRRGDFIRSLARLSITASGMYGDAEKSYVDVPVDVIDVARAIKSNKKTDADLPDPVNVYDLYEYKPDGTVGLTSQAIKALNFYLHYRNEVLSPEDKLADVPGPSKGCPVAQTGVTIHEDDLTEQQWADLLEGENPIAAYNAQSQKLRFRRVAIEETAIFMADVLDGNVS